jgi:thiol-disulfide isomerase/thioredoxin
MLSRRGVALAALALAACATPTRAADKPPRDRLAAIEEAQTAARDRYLKELQKVEKTEAAQKPALDRFLKELDENVGAALGLALDNPGDPAAFEALKFVIRTNRAGPGDATARALRLILDRGDDRRPGQGEYLAHVALLLLQYPDAEALLRRVLDRNASREDRAAACYWLACHLSLKSRLIRKLREKPEEQKHYEKYVAAEPIGKLVSEKDPDSLDRASEALLERAAGEFGDIRLTGEGQPLSERAGGELYALRNLDVGKIAPEIEGLDHEGKPFKLSETRGKVVVLTFSGNWCGPCVGMYPQERALLEKLRDRPFAIVSVNTDEEIGTLRKAIASGEITWRCWWDGGTDGPITTRWGVSSFPAIFVLDRRGVIRFKDLRGDDLDQAVAGLLDEPEPTASVPR